MPGLPSLLRLLPASAKLTECLLVHHEAAHDALVAASQGEAVPSEDDVEGLCGMQTKGRSDACTVHVCRFLLRLWAVPVTTLLLQGHARETKVQKVALCVSGLHATTSVVSHKSRREKCDDSFSFVSTDSNDTHYL